MERSTKEELEKWWHAQCPKCGWDGLSRDCAGGEPIADTGDFNDPLCPMCIKKDDCVVVDDYVEPDAQAAIAALQKEIATRDSTDSILATRIRELESRLTQRTTERDTARRRVDELEAREVDVVMLREDLEQRTAELEAANTLLYKKNCALGRAETSINDLQAELERVRADNKALDKWRADVTVALQRPEGAFFVDVPQHIKDLVKERDDLRTLILTLPKVEGEIVAKAGYLKDKDRVYALFASDEVMNAHLALWQHRQGMEGVCDSGPEKPSCPPSCAYCNDPFYGHKGHR